MKNIFKKILGLALIFLFSFGVAEAAINIVPNGGTGVGTISGIVFGNGTSPFSTVNVSTGLNLTGNTLTATGLASALNNTHLFVGNSSNVAVDGGANYTIDNIANNFNFAPVSGLQFNVSNTNDTGWLAQGDAGLFYTGPSSTGLLAHKGFGIDLSTGNAFYTVGDTHALMSNLGIDNTAFTTTLEAGNGSTAAMSYFQDAAALLAEISDEANRQYLSIDKGNNLYQIGDISTSGNGLKLSVDDAGQAITAVTGSFGNFTVQDTSGNRLFNTAAGSGDAEIGDLDGNYGGYTFNIDQNVPDFQFVGANYQFNGVNYIMPNTQGTTGQSLTIQGVTAGVGTLDWETVGGVGGSITDTQIGYGDASNNLTSDADFIRSSYGIQLDDNVTNHNMFIGGVTPSGNGTTTGTYNIGIGDTALTALTTGNHNTALGYATLRDTQDGFENTAIGGAALLTNVSGKFNTAVGEAALQITQTDNNTGIGYSSLISNITGSSLTAVGFGIDVDNGANTYTMSSAFGANAIISASNQMVFGTSSETHILFPGLPSATGTTPIGLVNVDSNGELGIVSGAGFLIGQTSGLVSNPTPATADGETWLGYQAGDAGATTSQTTFIGTQAGSGATFATGATFVGDVAGFDAVNSSYGTFIGNSAGSFATNASEAVFIGINAGANATNANNSEFIGQGAGLNAPNANNSIFIGNSAGNSDTVDNVNTVVLNFNTFSGTATQSFTVGETITGSISGATATVQYGLGLSDVLYVNNVSGVFQSGDVLTGGSSGLTANWVSTVIAPLNSIAIGDGSGTGGFVSSIAIGQGAVNTAPGQFLIGQVGGFGIHQVTIPAYPSTRDDSADVAPTNFLYTDTSGNVLSSPITFPTVVASNDLTAQTTAVNPVVQYTVGATDGTFTVGGYITITAISAGSLNLQVIYTDETSTVRTRTIVPNNGSLIATGVAMYPNVQIHAQAGSTITLLTTFGGASVTYNVGGTIEYMGH